MKNAKIIKIGPHLDISPSGQTFTNIPPCAQYAL